MTDNTEYTDDDYRNRFFGNVQATADYFNYINSLALKRMAKTMQKIAENAWDEGFQAGFEAASGMVVDSLKNHDEKEIIDEVTKAKEGNPYSQPEEPKTEDDK